MESSKSSKPSTIVLKLDRGMGRRALVTAIVALGIFVPVWLIASSISLPNSFTPGTVADANEVNANFQAVETAVNDNFERLRVPGDYAVCTA
ncbi:MAG: hypothetical protein AAF384_16120 [Pseudomonadota bacterium]